MGMCILFMLPFINRYTKDPVSIFGYILGNGHWYIYPFEYEPDYWR